MQTQQNLFDAALRDGRLYAGGNVQSLAGAAAVVYRLLTGANGGRVKIIVECAEDTTTGEGLVSLSLASGGTTSASGSAVALNNQNRVSSNTTLSTLHVGPTVTGAGTVISVGAARQPMELILAPSVLHLLTVTNLSTAGVLDVVVRVELME